MRKDWTFISLYISRNVAFLINIIDKNMKHNFNKF